MSFTPGQIESTKILSEELEKKIEQVNAHMVSQRNEAEKFQLKKNELELQIKDLEQKQKTLKEEVDSLKLNKDDLASEIVLLEEDISLKKGELVELKKENESMIVKNREESGKLSVEKENLKKRAEDLAAQEATLRVYGKALEEKEKKLDVYADRVKQILNSVKPE